MTVFSKDAFLILKLELLNLYVWTLVGNSISKESQTRDSPKLYS